MELVALQSLFPTIPSEPIDRATKLKEWEHEKLPGWRLLPGKAEREVADNFAFLAAADSRQEFISAVCIEERKGGGMTFRLAMNDGDLNEGVPRGIVDGLNEICKELEAAAMAEGEPALQTMPSHITANSIQARAIGNREKQCGRKYWILRLRKSSRI